MLELDLDHLPNDMRGLHPNSRNGKGTPKGQPKSESCREAMRKAYQKRRDSGWTQSRYQYQTPDGIMLLRQAADYYNISIHKVGYRAKSSNSQWKDWYRIEYCREQMTAEEAE